MTTINYKETAVLINGLPWIIIQKEQDGTYLLIRFDGKYHSYESCDYVEHRLRIAPHIGVFPRIVENEKFPS